MIGNRKKAQEAERQQLEKEDYINDAVRFSAFSMEAQQEDKNDITKAFIFLANLISIIFDSFLHINLGRDYVNPIGFILTLLQGAFVFVTKGWLLKIIGIFTFLWIAKWFGLFNFFDVPFDIAYEVLSSEWLIIFFAVGFVAMAIQAVYSFLTFKITKRFSYSNGTPWIFYITRIPFFKNSTYILYVEPLLIILVGLVVYFGASFLTLDNDLSLLEKVKTKFFRPDYDEAKFIVVFGVVYLLRNIYVHSLMDKAVVKRNDMGIQSIVENVTQHEEKEKTPAPVLAKMPGKPKASPADELEDFVED